MNPFSIKSLIFASVVAFCSHAQADLVDKSSTFVKTEAGMLAHYAQTFAAREASWRKKPNFRELHVVARHAKSGDTFNLSAQLDVDKNGNITNVSIVKSSGVRHLDIAAFKAFKKAQFYPFIRNGKPVEGRVILPIVYTIE